MNMYSTEINELEALIKANRRRANQIMGIGNISENGNGDTIKEVTKEEALELGKLNKEIYEANKRITELMKEV